MLEYAKHYWLKTGHPSPLVAWQEKCWEIPVTRSWQWENIADVGVTFTVCRMGISSSRWHVVWLCSFSHYSWPEKQPFRNAENKIASLCGIMLLDLSNLFSHYCSIVTSLKLCPVLPCLSLSHTHIISRAGDCTLRNLWPVWIFLSLRWSLCGSLLNGRWGKMFWALLCIIHGECTF